MVVSNTNDTVLQRLIYGGRRDFVSFDFNQIYLIMTKVLCSSDCFVMILSTTVLLLILALLLSLLLLVRRWLAYRERRLGYPKSNENFDDVKLLILLQQDIFALRCYRRIYPKASFAEAKYMVNKLSKQLQQQSQQVMSLEADVQQS